MYLFSGRTQWQRQTSPKAFAHLVGSENGVTPLSTSMARCWPSWLAPSFAQWLHHTNTFSSTGVWQLFLHASWKPWKLLCLLSIAASSCTLLESTTADWQSEELNLPFHESLLTDPLWFSVFNQIPNFLSAILVCDSKSGQDSQVPFWLLGGVISSTAEKSNKLHSPECNDTAFSQHQLHNWPLISHHILDTSAHFASASFSHLTQITSPFYILFT